MPTAIDGTMRPSPTTAVIGPYVPYGPAIIPFIPAMRSEKFVTMPMPRVSNTNIQYSLRRERPVNSAYLLSGKIAHSITSSPITSLSCFQGVNSARRSPANQLVVLSANPDAHRGIHPIVKKWRFEMRDDLSRTDSRPFQVPRCVND